ncbi:HNH endonuclease [Kocuria palustris]|uniref:HNH endonuclease n=1 Tax=Kocuria palustris TaxID=71999 RepID=UPI0016423F94|nr:HNH endonuclease [Kocuria palustris]
MTESQPRRLRNPVWTREEIVLVADAVVANEWRELRQTDPQVVELSRQLRRLPFHPPASRPADFRSPGSVSRKTADIVTARSTYRGAPTKGGALTRQVVHEFENDPGLLREQAAVVRKSAFGGEIPNREKIADPDLGVTVSEGGVLEKAHLARERDRVMRESKIKAVRAAGGEIACEVCGFHFGRFYGARGDGYIEVHHRVPLHVSGPTATSLADLALLCSNCHRMIHRGTPWLTVEQLADIVEGSVRR